MKLFERAFDSNRKSYLVENPTDIDFLNQKILLCLPTDEAVGKKVANPVGELDIYQKSMFGYVNFSQTQSLEQVNSNINGFMKLAQRIVGGTKLIDSGIKLISVAYDDDMESTNSIKNRENYNKAPNEFYSREAEEFVVKNCLNLVANNVEVKIKYKNSENGDLVETGRVIKGDRFSVEQVSKNLSNLTIFAGSRGTTFAGEMCNCLRRYMKDFGYGEDEIKSSLKNVSLLGVGSTIRTDAKDSLLFNSVLIVAHNDKVVEDSIGSKKFKESITKNSFPYVEKINDNVLRLVVENPDHVEYATYHTEKDIAIDKDKSNFHHIRLYVSYAKNRSNLIPVISENVLRNMLYKDNKSSKNIEDFLIRFNEAPSSNKTSALTELRSSSRGVYDDSFIKDFVNRNLRQKFYTIKNPAISGVFYW